jgi:hypothetical protein
MVDERARRYSPPVKLLETLRRKLRIRSLERGDYSAEGDRRVSNADAEAAAATQNCGYPPGYVNDYDDGRPRH